MKIINVKWLPFGWDAMAVRPFVFVREWSWGILAHEEVHLQQQKDFGLFKYGWRYITNVRWRVAMEYQAYNEGSGLGPIAAKDMADRYKKLFPWD
jgi:hypothetical protein